MSYTHFRKLLRSAKTLFLYNHCVFWPSVHDFIAKSQGPVWFRYHNVTPPEFFQAHDAISAFATRKGREQTVEILRNFDFKITRYLPVSPYNLSELQAMGASPEKCTVLPPFHRLEDFAQCTVNSILQKRLQDGKTNVLFVGRVVPNKAFEKLLITLHTYVEHFGAHVRFIFAGGLSENFKSYYKQLLRLINEHKLSPYVEWTGKISFNDLHTYYRNAHAFLILSEHEGFCLPILEAQMHKIPIIGVRGTAIHDTIGADQLCFPNYDPSLLAAAIHKVRYDETLRKDLIQAGLKNLDRYSLDTLNRSLVNHLKANL